ncbi:transcription initiation factor TFIID subunit 7 [Tanacetum coccineum]
MEEQFILRVPRSVAERIDLYGLGFHSLVICFFMNAYVRRRGTFTVGDGQFLALLFDLPCIVESHKTYDDSVLIKTADVGQMIMVRNEGDPAPKVVVCRHGLTPPMRDARRRRFRSESDLNVQYLIILNLLQLKFNLEMSSMQEDIQCAGSDTRPPMLDRTDFESWQQRIRLYCLGKDNGENIMKSIKEGPFHMGTVSDVI